MRRTLSVLVSGAACVGLYVALSASPAAAEQLGCPDDMTIVPAAFVHQGSQKDHNGNTFVCAKPTTCLEASGPICHGGPDDDLFGRPLLGADGNWYYVTDDV